MDQVRHPDRADADTLTEQYTGAITDAVADVPADADAVTYSRAIANALELAVTDTLTNYPATDDDTVHRAITDAIANVNSANANFDINPAPADGHPDTTG